MLYFKNHSIGSGTEKKLLNRVSQITGTNNVNQEELLTTLFAAIEHSPVSIVITDRNAKITYVNPKFLEITGYSLNEVLGQNPKVLKTIHTPKHVYQDLWNTITKNKVWQGEFINKRKDGSLYIEKATITPFSYKNGTIKNYLALKEDITAQREAENELEKKHAQLKSQRAVLKKALEKVKSSQSQMIQNEKMASLGQLSAGIAHEINNPINFIYTGTQVLKEQLKAIKKHIEMLKSRELSNTNDQLAFSAEYIEGFEAKIADFEETTDDIFVGAQRISSLVKNLNSFTHSDIRGQKKYDLHEGLRVTLSILKYKLNNIEVVMNLQEQPAYIYCFPGQINQVFMNLIVNALQAMETGGQLTISSKLLPGKLEIKIADTGIGIPEGIKQRIFDPFFTTKEVGEGSGLGLSISHHIVAKHNGNLRLEDVPSGGTVFVLELPV